MESVTPRIIYQEANPYSSFTAFLENDGRTVYLYLQSEHNPEIPIKSLWIRNLLPAPKSHSENDFKDGLAPLLIEEEVFHPEGQPSFREDEIHFIWTEEGDGVGLFIHEELYAFLPPWSGIKGFHGYSKEAKIDAICASPLGDSGHGVIAERIESSRKFWEFRSEKEAWNKIQKHRLDFLENSFGTHEKYWSADGGKFPQLGIARFRPEQYPGILVYSTIGMSAQNMPQVELYHKDYLRYARSEVIFAIKISDDGDRSESWIPHLIGELIRYPWNMGSWLGNGHTILMTRKDPDALRLNFTSIVLTNEISPSETKGLLAEDGNPVNFLFGLPITEEENFLIKQEGASTLFKMMKSEKDSWVHDSERESFL
ncbi:MAG: suppressor of fused domain protein [Leptospira sp.]|nr:suppressor of fused domain protein [Leptospira sp.]